MGHLNSLRYSTASSLFFALLLLALPSASDTVCRSQSELPALSGNIVKVANTEALHQAVSQLKDDTTLLLSPGTYALESTLFIKKNNVTISGSGANCEETILRGKGMENADHGGVPHGIWSNAKNLTVTNLTIRDVYQHGIILNSGAQSPKISSVRLLDAGTQFIKSNPTRFGEGVDNGLVEYSQFAYTSAPPNTDHGGGKGYTNGVDVHAGDNWIIRYNLFENFHTPDSSQWWWNPAVLVWNGASGSIVEGNKFINVDRAISLGLMDRSKDAGRAKTDTDHRGGSIHNNMIVYRKNLFSRARRGKSDAAIIVWDSPETKVSHNTILTNGNIYKSIEFRFDTTGAEAVNNLVDAEVGSRDSGVYRQQNNVSIVSYKMFANPEAGDLRLVKDAMVIGGVRRSPLVAIDIDGEARDGNKVDPGADEYSSPVQGSITSVR